jgi:hypothetical protein
MTPYSSVNHEFVRTGINLVILRACAANEVEWSDANWAAMLRQLHNSPPFARSGGNRFRLSSTS